MILNEKELIIGGKSLPVINEINALKNKGCNYFEAHTTEKYIKEYNISEIKQITKKINMYCVHAPMFSNGVHLALGDGGKELNELNLKIIKDTLDFADKFSNVEEPIVVVHLGLPSSLDTVNNRINNIKYLNHNWEVANNQIYEIKNYMESKRYANVLAIENTSRYSYHESDSSYGGEVRYLGAEFDAPSISKMNTSSEIGSCLDLCHAQMDIVINRLSDFKSKLCVQDYIKEFSDSIKLVHFNNSINFGIGKDHSQTYKGYEEKHREIVKGLIENNYTRVPWTLEVLEESFVGEKAFNNYEIARELLIEEVNKLDGSIKIRY